MSRPPKVKKSPVTKRSLSIGARKTSITLESPFWLSLKEIAVQQGTSVGQLVIRIDEDRQYAPRQSM